MNDERDSAINRRQKLDELIKDDAFDYPNDVNVEKLSSVRERYAEYSQRELQKVNVLVRVAGRILSRRLMGKASFSTIQDRSAQLQLYLRSDDIVDDGYALFVSKIDIGDIIRVEGTMMRTNTGELSVHVNRLQLLCKSLHPLPEKFHGVTDVEIRYRQRYLDLIVNEKSRETFRVRSEIVQTIRRFFEDREFLEVETPMMHPIPGGAVARPFVTHHNALDMDFYLRVAPELYLKRLVVGGFERVFEINRNFRNEGVSSKHSPEFTMLEFYQAYATFEDLIELTTVLIRKLIDSVKKPRVINYQGTDIDFHKDPKVQSMQDAVAEHFGVSSEAVASREGLSVLVKDSEDEDITHLSWGVMLNELFERHVEATLIQPTYITHHPAESSPLAMRNKRNPKVTDRFELFVAGREIANAFSELNDPDDQRERFEYQARLHSEGDVEAMHYDADYVRALEYGMPPTAGEGIGIDRLVMLLTDQDSIRDVILFPAMRDR